MLRTLWNGLRIFWHSMRCPLPRHDIDAMYSGPMGRSYECGCGWGLFEPWRFWCIAKQVEGSHFGPRVVEWFPTKRKAKRALRLLHDDAYEVMSDEELDHLWRQAGWEQEGGSWTRHD